MLSYIRTYVFLLFLITGNLVFAQSFYKSKVNGIVDSVVRVGYYGKTQRWKNVELYNKKGFLIEDRKVFEGKVFSISRYFYDSLGNDLSMDNNSNAVRFIHTYDKNGRITYTYLSKTSGEKVYEVRNMSYDARNRLASYFKILYANGGINIISKKKYNLLYYRSGEMKRIDEQDTVNKTASSVTYNKRGEQKRIVTSEEIEIIDSSKVKGISIHIAKTRYLHFYDRKGNWTKRFSYFKLIPRLREERKIYYSRK